MCEYWGFQVKCVFVYWGLTFRSEDGLIPRNGNGLDMPQGVDKWDECRLFPQHSIPCLVSPLGMETEREVIAQLKACYRSGNKTEVLGLE